MTYVGKPQFAGGCSTVLPGGRTWNFGVARLVDIHAMAVGSTSLAGQHGVYVMPSHCEPIREAERLSAWHDADE